MYSKILMFMVAVVVFVMGQMPENVKYRNFIIPSFKADSVKYSPWFNVADLANIVVQARFDDTTSDGFADDSCCFTYALQLGNVCFNANGRYDTAALGQPILIDSVNTTVAAKWRPLTVCTYLQDDGTYADSLGVLDSTLVTGFGTNGHSITPSPSCFGRILIKGGSDNKVENFIRLTIDVIQFKATKVSNREPINVE